jgi:hypothetical protein
MRTDEEWIDLYESLHKNNMMWFALASMISAENFYLLDKEKKISVYEQNIRYLTQIATLLPKSNIDVKERKKMVKYAKRGVKILQKEYNELIEKQ